MIHFITGLPRSGTTLLAAILRQNPEAWASIETPMGPIVNRLLEAMNPDVETHFFLDEDDRKQIIHGAFWGFHGAGLTFDGGDVIFDNNRAWAAKIPLLSRVFPDAKFIVMLRPYDQIIDSLERIFREHPTYVSKIIPGGADSTVFSRTNWITSPQGLLGYAVNATQEAWFGPFKDRCLFLDYNQLVTWPDIAMERIHDFCGIPRYDYDFGVIDQIPDVDKFDLSIGTPGLHTVGPKVEYRPYVRQLPPAVYGMLAEPFWLKKDETTNE